MRRFVRHIEDEGVHPPSIRKNLAPLKALFATAYEDVHIASNPTVGLRIRIGHGDKKVKALTRDELRLVLAALPDEWRTLFTLLAQTGLRISEALGLTWGDVDLGAQPKVESPRFSGHLTTCALEARKDGVRRAENPTRIPT